MGVGFRLGDHADFQVLLELGPQINTQPLGSDGHNETQKTRHIIAFLPLATKHDGKSSGLALTSCQHQDRTQLRTRQEENGRLRGDQH